MLFIVVTVLLAAIIILKCYIKFTTGICKSNVCMVGKTALITGANTGIGYETALEFAKRGANVILACRNQELADKAKNKIIEETGNKNVCVKIVDLGSLESVRKLAEDVNKTVNRLDILVNNAGAGGLGEKQTKDGLDILMQVNYFGPFLLTNLLIGLLKKSGPSRIVNVSSIASRYGKIDPKDLNKKDPDAFNYDAQMYANTKLCNILFTIELAKRLSNTEVTTNSLHPGAVFTDIYRRIPNIVKPIIFSIFKFFFKTATEGAQTSIHLSIANELENVSGKYFVECKVHNHYPSVRENINFTEQVWETSMKMVKLKPEELQF